MDKNQISSGQMLSLMVMFQIGTAIVINMGYTSGKDTWITILVCMVLGAGLFWIYSCLSKQFPKMPLTAYSRILLGKVMGNIVGMLYIAYFIYIGCRNLRDGANLINISTLNTTPLVVTTTLMLLCISYVVYLGFEVLARTAVLLLVFLLFVGLLSNILLISSNAVQVDLILPLFEDGIKPVLKGIFTENLIIPFGEMVCFLMLLPYMRRPEKGGYIGVISIIIGGLILSQTMFLNVACLGLNISKRSAFPLLSTISLVEISEFVQRVDILVVMSLIIGEFFRISLYFSAALIGASDIFNVTYRKLILPIAFIMLVWTTGMARNFIYHLEYGRLALYYIHPLFVFYFPLLLMGAGWIHKRRKRRTRV
ncbi:GerAB/ArcD/ProY family transporter [Paenibacillus gallinarum]|uniref:GerAB/ArcD/ProY family transporter n=1 Tax=Paenibacillus gallinarum TaxID=2762232 RepID=A0ABR8SZW7_9BACL|nr:GerAB/ArcD/ProY family transporter [Paenibacillus gallinarum]MBD7969054.1 GerAB/ArcD/ProY family transporter [Paenibacillus gallinarum]